MIRKGASGDAGISLVELLIYILLAAIVGTIVASILINSLRVQVQIQDASAAAQTSFLVADAVGAAVRDSTDIAVATLPSGVLVVRTRSLDPSQDSTTSLGPESFVCYAFAAYGDRVSFTTSTTAIPDPVISTGASGDVIEGWTLLGDAVERVDAGTPVFGVLDGGTALRLALVTDRGDGGPQQLTTIVRSLQGDDAVTGERVSDPCF